MFYSFKSVPVSINNQSFLIEDMEFGQEIGLNSPYKNDHTVSEDNIPQSPYHGFLRIKYFLTGQDYLKQYCFSKENQSLTGNIANLTFSQGYLTSYNLTAIPNSPVQVNASIDFFDKVRGFFIPTNPIYSTGKILNLSDIQIDSLDGYTSSILDNIIQANFSYSCEVTPSYKAIGTGATHESADRVSIGRRIISTEINSDSCNMDLSLSGEDYGINMFFCNPYNSGIQENFGCSGKIYSKTINLSAPNTHIHNIKINQNHLNNKGGISGVIINSSNFLIYSNPDTHPFISQDGSMDYVNKITLGDTICTGFSVNRGSNYDIIDVPIPENAQNSGILTIYSNLGTFIYNNPINIDFPPMSIEGMSDNSGSLGSMLRISGNNFYRITNVSFGTVVSKFYVVDNKNIDVIIPEAITSNINIYSQRVPSVNTSIFFCEPNITNLFPTTGQ